MPSRRQVVDACPIVPETGHLYQPHCELASLTERAIPGKTDAAQSEVCVRRLAATLAVSLALTTACVAGQQAETATESPLVTPTPSPTTAPTPSPTTAPSASPSVEATRGPYQGDASTIVGTWRDGFGHLIEFLDDGTFVVDNGMTDGGTYTFDGTTLTYFSEPSSRNCPGQEGIYDVTFYDGGTLAELAFVRDECGRRGQTITQASTYDRLGS